MSIFSQQQNVAQKINSVSSWEDAISRMDAELAKIKKRAVQLKASRNVFIGLQKDGMVWPGSIKAVIDGIRGEEAGAEKDSVPA
jgi:hypothetical protein